jgi:hypothetical protein
VQGRKNAAEELQREQRKKKAARQAETQHRLAVSNSPAKFL